MVLSRGAGAVKLREAMDATASAAWSAVADGDVLGIRLREDTVTEGALLHLARHFPRLILYKFNPTEEKSTGGDWEWFVGSRRRGWIAFRIQAKRMDRLRYRQLSHGGQLSGERQYDTLIRDSAAATVPTFPFHVFFNGWATGWPAGIPWNACPNRRTFPRCTHHEMTHMGCSLLPANAVRTLHRSSGSRRLNVATYLPSSVPWSWLFGPPPGHAASGWGSVGSSPGVRELSELLAWHEMMGPMRDWVASPATGSKESAWPSSAKELTRRWVSLRQQGEYAQRRPAEQLPAYAEWGLRAGLRQRQLGDRLDESDAEAWNYLGDEAMRGEEPGTFSIPSGLSGLAFTPWPEG